MPTEQVRRIRRRLDHGRGRWTRQDVECLLDTIDALEACWKSAVDQIANSGETSDAG